MNWRLLRIACISICLVAAGALGVSAQGQRPGSAPPGGPPPVALPQGVPPAGGLPPGGSGPGAAGRAPNGTAASHLRSANTSRTTNGGLRLGPVGRWWDDRSVTQTIGLRKEQQRAMDAIFNANKPAILANYKALLSEKSKLEAISKDPKVDQTRLFAAIDTVNQARASLQKATSQMLLQIRQQMDPGQIVKLEALP